MTAPDLLVISIAIGIVVSFIFSEVYGIAAGGVVVPGYIALYMNKPYALVMTIAIALVSFALTKVVGSVFIIYGRRRTALTILIAFALGAWLARAPQMPMFFQLQSADAVVIGYIIPGIIGIWFDRQGILPTAAALTLAAVIVRLILLLLVGPLGLQAAGAL